LETIKWDCILADEVITNVIIIQNNKAKQQNFRQHDLELETFIVYWAVAFIGHCLCLPLCSAIHPLKIEGLHGK
jgi:hypothetical protein